MTYEEAKDILRVSDANTKTNLLGARKMKWRQRKNESFKFV